MTSKVGRTHRWPSGPVELRIFFDFMVTQGGHGLSLQVIPEKSRETPLTTCFLYNWCQSPRRAVFTQGSYRLSLEPREKIEGNTVDFQALAPFSKAMGNSESVGRGADGQYWLCLRDLELLYEGRFERLTGDANTPLTHLYEYVRFIESLYPETRPNSSIPGTLNLRSAQKHTVYLWIAVHRYVLYLADPVNAGVKKLLDQGVACEKAFPGDVYPALTGQALYRSTEALNYRGRASNGNFAELTWAQVISRDLSEALVMSEELVATVEKDSNEEEGNGECKDADSDKEKDASSQALDNATARKRQKRSVKLNRLVDKASSSTKRGARPTPPVSRVQPESSLSQPSPTTTFKLKFQPKRPLPRPHKAFLQEKKAPEATSTRQEDENKEVEKGSNSVLSSVDPKTNRGEHGEVRTESTTTTVDNVENASSPKPASEGQKRDNEGALIAAAPENLDGEKDETPLSLTSTTEVAPSTPLALPPSRPLKFAPKQTSRLCKKKISVPKEAQTAEQEKQQTGV